MQKTIMFYINSLNRGGAERVLLQLARHFSQHGWRAIVVTSFVTSSEYPVPEGVERISIEQDQIKQSRLKRNWSRIRKLRHLIKEIQPVVLISFMREPNFRAICATVGLGTKRVISVRNDPNRSYSGLLGGFIGKILLPFADGCVFQTQDAKSWFPKRLRDKSKVIFNEVDTKFFEADYVGGNHVVTIGRLTEQKNHRMLIRAFACIAEKHPEWDLQIWGSGELESALVDEIAELNMDNRIFLKGLTTNVPSVLSEAGIFVLSSDYEGMPNALMEALAVGVPSISTDCPCGGPKALIDSDENGLLIPVKDEKALVIALDMLMTERVFAKKLGENARMKAQSYSPDVIFVEWKNYIEKVIET